MKSLLTKIAFIWVTALVALVAVFVALVLFGIVTDVRRWYWERRRKEAEARLAESQRLLDEAEARLAATNERLLDAETDAFMALLWAKRTEHNEENN